MKPLKVIFIDDDTFLADLVKSALESEYNYKVHIQNTVIGIMASITEFKPDIIVLDVEIGDENGIETAKRILDKHPRIPILFVSSHTAEEFITRGIDVGGNAYIPKPLSISVLASYIRRFTSSDEPAPLIVADYKLNLHTNELYCKNTLLKKLSHFEKTALELLMQNEQRVICKEQLVEKLWDGKSSEKENTASLHNTISKLRDLLKENQSVKIETVRGVGYILNRN
jgi:DNA-binding response OmpR family regulator